MNIICKVLGHKERKTYNIFGIKSKIKCKRCKIVLYDFFFLKKLQYSMKEMTKNIVFDFGIPKHYLGLKERARFSNGKWIMQ